MAAAPVFHQDAAVTEFPGRGTGVAALAALPPDVVVAEELPVAWCFDEEYELNFCATCADGLPDHLCGRACPTCRVGIGACEGCAPIHTDAECKAFAALEALLEDAAESFDDDWKIGDLRALIRLLCRLRTAVGAPGDHPVYDLSTAPASGAAKKRFRDVAADLAAEASGYPRKHVAALAGIVETNCYSIFAKAWYRPSGAYEPEHSHVTPLPVGIAVYIDLSRFNHSCAPNLTKIPTGLSMQCVSLRPIPAGEELCHAYVAPSTSAGKRRDELQHSWGFRCACPRCADAADMWALRALCGCGGYLIQDPEDLEAGVCHACGEWAEVEAE